MLDYDATLAGLVLSPGGIVVILLIPLVGLLMRHVQTRFIIIAGFAMMGLSFIYCSGLVPNIDFRTLMLMRSAQTAGLAFIFAPISTIAFATLCHEQSGDAAALNTMVRNVAGSVGISAATAMVAQQSQVRMAHLSTWMTPLNPPFAELLARQAGVMAYGDVFLVFAALSFLVVPLGLLFSPSTGGRG